MACTDCQIRLGETTPRQTRPWTLWEQLSVVLVPVSIGLVGIVVLEWQQGWRPGRRRY